ncbi:uncharacterized protein LOC128556753 isoform X2 [Mercenaria mercenaria]|uniref:uncharacterized protein LOC128556753 isoform X2 n=1 Tax=Mercenaria mercenaria TaxID=6596 RepID=UPI00234E54D3|nr:uncharacterized protein LOC128556753 isoform X2 [Mercenaria mercenaria]
MDRQASALVLLIGFYLNCFVTGKGYRSASLADDKEIVSDDSNTLSRHQRDVDVPLEYQGVCGIPPVQIDMRFFRCDDAEIVAKSTSATTTSTPKPNDICRCCVLDAYKRSSSDIPCEHASSNDRLFRKWKKLVSDQALCTMNERETRQVYKIDIDVQESKGDRRYLEAKVSMWTWTPSSRSENGTDLRSPPTKKGYMEIRLDKYSPRKKNLTGRSFFTITEKNYLEKAIFFLNPNDNLYKWPKNVKKISNLLQKIQRQCSQKNEQIAK